MLLEAVNAAGKDWKRQTLNTLVTRLMEKGLVNRENRHVCAAMDKQAYSNLQVEEVVREVYAGKLSNLVLAFAKDKKLTKEDAKELEKLLEAYETE